jgi:protein SCO1/2
MKNFSKAGLLIVTLVIPALIFTFLKFFATNHYDLSYFNPERDLNGQVLIQNGDTVFHKVAGICLEGGANTNLKGLTIVSYLPDVCDDSCKVMLAQLQRISDLRNDIPGVNIITAISSKHNVKELPEEIGKPGWRLVDRSKEVIDTCFAKDLGLDLNVKKGPGSNRLVLIDDKGFVRGYYNGADEVDTDRLMAEIKILDYESKNSESK